MSRSPAAGRTARPGSARRPPACGARRLGQRRRRSTAPAAARPRSGGARAGAARSRGGRGGSPAAGASKRIAPGLRPQQRGRRRAVDDRARPRLAQRGPRRPPRGHRPGEVGERERPRLARARHPRHRDRRAGAPQRGGERVVGRAQPGGAAEADEEDVGRATGRGYPPSGPACGSAGSARAAASCRRRSGSRRAPRSRVTAASWRRQASAQMIAKPAATAATCGMKIPRIAAPSVENSSGQSRLSSVSPGRSSGSDICIRASASSRAIGGEAALRRPSHAADQRGDEPPADRDLHQRARRRSPRTRATVSAASSVAEPALSRTVALRKSTNRTGRQISSASSSSRTPSVPSTMTSASSSSAGGPSSERTPTRSAVAEPAHLDQLVRARGTRRCRCRSSPT